MLSTPSSVGAILAVVAIALAMAASGAVLLQLGRILAPVEDGAGVAWSLIAVMVTVGAAGSAGGIDPVAVWRWVVESRVGLALLVGPAVVSWLLVAAGVRTAAWLTDPTPLGALGLGLALAAVPLSRGSRRRPG